MSSAGKRSLFALALQVAALAALTAAWLGLTWLDERSLPRQLLLVDRSDSMPHAAVDHAVAEVAQAVQDRGPARLLALEFAGRPADTVVQAPLAATQAPAPLEPWSTDIERALLAALMLHAHQPLDRVVVVSDGHATSGDTQRGLRALHAAGLPVQWRPVGRPAPGLHIAEVLAPVRARPDQTIEIGVRLGGSGQRAVQVEATARSATGRTRTATASSDASGLAVLTLDAGADGPLVVDLSLNDRDSGATLETRPDAAVIDIVARAALLYAHASAAPLAQALARGGWTIETVPATRLDDQVEGLDNYRAVVLDDVAVGDAGPRFWNALVRAVRERGVGLLVLGGERSFARGGYRGSTLESLLPLVAEPAAPDRKASILFAVDKSGSMGRGAAGIDRFALARRAVIETARGAGPDDAVGLLVFDIEPRVLLPLTPSASALPMLEREWPVAPNGGTRLAPALDAAIGLLERSGRGRRLLVLVTDGFVDQAPLEGLKSRLARAGIEALVLAIGADADTGALARAVGEPTALVLQVGEAAELPQAMRSGVERRRARVQRGDIAVHQRAPLPFAPRTAVDWPVVAGHALTRARPEAEVLLETALGDPLLATWRSGLGAVLALPAGLGAWTPQWLTWREWPRLAGGLAEAVGGQGAGATAHTVTVTEGASELVIEADFDLPLPSDAAALLSITVETPKAGQLRLRTEQIAPGRLRAAVPDAGPGLYAFVLAGPRGAQRHLHLRRRSAEGRDWGTNPALRDWARQGLLTAGDAAPPASSRVGIAMDRPPDRWLVGLALVMFLLGVVVDRAQRDAIGQVLDRLRRRVRRV